MSDSNITWYSKEECIALTDAFVKKFDDGNLTVNDSDLFFKGLFGAIYQSMEEDDDIKVELWENMQMDLEEYENLEYHIEIRDTDFKFIMHLTPEEIKLGEYKELPSAGKNNTWMDWTPACQVKIMKGDPNTDAEFFSGDCTVKGSTRLGSLPRTWIYDFFAFIDREVE